MFSYSIWIKSVFIQYCYHQRRSIDNRQIVKPKTPAAMQQLIQQVRETLPFNMPQAYVCADECKGCSLKLLEFLDLELMDWEDRLQRGEVPGLKDIQHMAKISQRIYKVLDKNGVLDF